MDPSAWMLYSTVLHCTRKVFCLVKFSSYTVCSGVGTLARILSLLKKRVYIAHSYIFQAKSIDKFLISLQ